MKIAIPPHPPIPDSLLLIATPLVIPASKLWLEWWEVEWLGMSVLTPPIQDSDRIRLAAHELLEFASGATLGKSLLRLANDLTNEEIKTEVFNALHGIFILRRLLEARPQFVMTTIQELNDRSRHEPGQQAHAERDQEPAQIGGRRQVKEAKTLLTGWHEIARAVGMKHEEYKKIKSLNARNNGPIKGKGQGHQPLVNRDELIDWWNHLARLQQELANQRCGRKMAADAQHAYGRTGVVAPEIGGGVKKRRRT